MTAVLCDDDDLGYLADRTRFEAGKPLALDRSYRLAHLPLVAPGHPDAIDSAEGSSYVRGRHPPVTSLVLPVPGKALHEALSVSGLESELEGSRLSAKIAWSVLPRRRDRLHATLCGLRASGESFERLTLSERAALKALGPLTVSIRGLFSGTFNLGRLYLRAYPEKRGGHNVFHRIQDIVGGRRTDVYLVGVYNLIDGLNAAEAATLAALLERWWHCPLLTFQADALWLLRSFDDLVLDGTIEESIPLC